MFFWHCVLFLVTNTHTVILHTYYMDFEYGELVTDDDDDDDDDDDL